ncbi:cell adhesion molecule CEACAM5-like [Ciona intestinalis]
MRSDQILNMNCSANSNPNPVYRWEICQTAAVCIGHVGNYYTGSVPVNTTSVFCQAQNYLGSTKSQRMNITVVSTNRLVSLQASPNISPSNGMKLERHLGHNSTITCSVDHQGQLNTTYALKLPNGITITKPTIELAALATTDTGNYSCVTNDVFGSFSSSVYIDVIYPPQTARTMVICNWVIGNIGFCVITFSSNPPVNLIELKNIEGEIIDHSTQTSHYNTETQVYNFTVQKVMDTDFGNYTLKVKSTKFPRSSLTIKVVINGNGLAAPTTTNKTILIAVIAGSFVLLVILIVIMYILYKKKQKGKLYNMQLNKC